MKSCFAVIAALLAAQCYAQPGYAEIDVSDVCRDWSTFPEGTWTNDRPTPIAITDIKLGVYSADSMVGEVGLWFSSPNYGLIFSFGPEIYVPPSSETQSTYTFAPDARYVIQPGETLVLRINCGWVNSPGTTPQQPVNGVQPAPLGWKPFAYVGAAKFHFIEVP